MQIVRKMTELEAFEVLSVVLKHPVLLLLKSYFLTNLFKLFVKNQLLDLSFPQIVSKLL